MIQVIKVVAAMHEAAIIKVCEDLSRLKGWNLKSANGALRCVPAITKEVEAIGAARKLTGAEKNDLAVEFILRFLPLPWWLPESYARPLLGAIVSAIVDALKDKFA